MDTETAKYNIFDLGFDKFLSRAGFAFGTLQDANSDLASLLDNVVENPTDPSQLTSGEWFGNITIKDGYLQSGNYVAGFSGWKLTPLSGELNFAVSVSSLNIPNITTANSFHVNTNGDSWWGCNVADFASDNNNAIAYILKTGIAKFQHVTLSGGSNVIFISDTLDTSSKKILKDFTFGSTDYAGSLKTGDITWNATTGAITGGSGILINKGGIVGANGGVTTFLIDGATGNATFSGTLAAIGGNFGTITGGNITFDTAGYIRGGQTAFKTGDGVFLGYDTTPELDIFSTPAADSDYTWANGSTSAVGVRFYNSSGTQTIKKITIRLKVDSGTTGTLSCDIYAASSSYLPTGASLGTATATGISNTSYAEVDFIFSTPVSINSSDDHVVAFTCATSNVPIKMAYEDFAGSRGSIHFLYYDGSWHEVGSLGTTFPWIRIYSYNAGYKLSVGNTSYGLSYNGVNMQTLGSNIIRTSNNGDQFNEIHYYGMNVWDSGQRIMILDPSTGLLWRGVKGLTDGFLKYGQIMPFAVSANDVLTYAGIRIQSGKTSSYDLVIYATDNNAIRLDGSSSGSGYSGGVLVVGGAGGCEIGSSGHKATVYCSGLSSCPLPTVDSALSMLADIPDPKEKDELANPNSAHFEYTEQESNNLKIVNMLDENQTVKRKYFDVVDVPDELTFINDEGEKDIELIRTIGFLFKAVKELNEEINLLKK